MKRLKLSRCFRRIRVHLQLRDIQNIYPQKRFQRMVLRERTRADHNNHLISLILFDIAPKENNGTLVPNLLTLIAKGLRSAGKSGWFDREHIGVLLPDTNRCGAIQIVEDICSLVKTTVPPLGYRVYTYPVQWPPNDSGHETPTYFVGSHSQSQSKKCQGVCINGVGDNLPNTQQSSANAPPNGLDLLKLIEPFFVHSMPFWKRMIDLFGALLALVVLSPLMVLIALFIKIVSPGPVFYKQERIGTNGSKFTMLKFRTMTVDVDPRDHQEYVTGLIHNSNNKEEDKPMAKLGNHADIIPLGRMLRNTALDELPQLFNVLKGEMSLVGPRPPIPYEVEQYLPWHFARFDATPGMTGLWQVSGKNRLSFTEMMRLDIQYAAKISCWSDIAILLKTPIAIITQIADNLRERRVSVGGGVVKHV